MRSQKEKLQRGLNFQEEMRRSWLMISNVWRLRIDDSSGIRPGDSLILTNFEGIPINILVEYKRKKELNLRLNDLRAGQIKGLADFEKVNPWHHSLIIVNFLDEEKDIDDTYAILYKEFIYYIKTFKKVCISREVIKQLVPINCTHIPIRYKIDGTKTYQVGRVLPWLASM